MRRLKWREIVFFRGVLGDLTPANAAASVNQGTYNLLVPFPTPYAEAGIGIENIFKIFRVDVFRRLTYLNSPLATQFGVRAGFQLIL
jgi:hypothetical protein